MYTGCVLTLIVYLTTHTHVHTRTLICYHVLLTYIFPIAWLLFYTVCLTVLFRIDQWTLWCVCPEWRMFHECYVLCNICFASEPFFITVFSLSDIYYAFWSPVLPLIYKKFVQLTVLGTTEVREGEWYHARCKNDRSKMEVL